MNTFKIGDRAIITKTGSTSAAVTAGDVVTIVRDPRTNQHGTFWEVVAADGCQWSIYDEDLSVPVEGATYGTFVTKDSGTRRAFDTGSQRDDATGKGRYDLIPLEAVHRLAQLYERGAAKYDDRNWEKGQPLSVVLNSMLRHAHQAAAGRNDEDHLAAVAWNAFAAITILERIAVGALPGELDDRPAAA